MMKGEGASCPTEERGAANDWVGFMVATAGD